MPKKPKQRFVPPGGWTPEMIRRREKAIGLNPWGGGNHNSLGCEFFEMGAWDRAADEFEIAISINPWKAHYRANIARAYIALGRYDEAEVMAKAALERKPQMPSALFSLGLIAEARHRYEEAADWYRLCLASGADVVIRKDVKEDLEIVLGLIEKQKKEGQNGQNR